MRGKKKYALGFLMLFLFLFAAGCASAKLSGDFKEETVKAAVKEAVDYVNDGEYEKVWGMLREDLQDQVDSGDIKKVKEDNHPGIGAFKKFKSISLVGQKNEESGEEFAVAVAVASYEEGQITFTITFDTKMNMTGFYMK